MQQIAQFLNNLFAKGDLKVHSMEEYKSAIAATLKTRGVNVGTDPYIFELVSSSTETDR